MSDEKKFFAEILKDSFVFFVKNVILLMEAAMCFLLPMITLDVIYSKNKMYCTSDAPEGLMALPGYWIVFIVSILILLLFFSIVVVVKATQGIDEGRELTVSSVYSEASEAYKDFLVLKGKCFLSVLLKSLLLIVPGIIAFVQYGFSSMANIVDGKKSVEALEYSKRIISRYWVQYLDYCLSILGIFILMMIPVVVILDVFIGAAIMKNFILLARFFDFIEAAIIMFSSVYLVVFYYFLYKEFKRRSILNKIIT